MERDEFMDFAKRVYDFLDDFHEEVDGYATVSFQTYYEELPRTKGNSPWYYVKSREFQRAVVRYIAATYQHPADADDVERLARKHGLRVWDIEVRGAENGDVQVEVSLEPERPLETDVVYG